MENHRVEQSIAEELGRTWSEGDVTLFDTLGEFAVEARYHDPEWAEKQATKEHAEYWLGQTRSFLSHVFP
jgi:hypothetical protein